MLRNKLDYKSRIIIKHSNNNETKGINMLLDYQVALTLKSRNTKTGPIPVSTTTYSTCPDACPLRKNGCYAGNGPLFLFWQKVTDHNVGGSWQAFVDQIAKLKAKTLWRHNQAGDLPGNRVTIDKKALLMLVKANMGKLGFTYTHYDVINNKTNSDLVSQANKDGFTINLSANNIDHADKLKALNVGPVAVVLPSSVQGNQKLTTPNGNKIVVCPATYRDDVSCKSCGLCAMQRDAIVGFPAHGVQVKRADKIAA